MPIFNTIMTKAPNWIFKNTFKKSQPHLRLHIISANMDSYQMKKHSLQIRFDETTSEGCAIAGERTTANNHTQRKRAISHSTGICLAE